MIGFASIVLLAYAVLMIVGGIMGYRAVGSAASLIAGSISGALLLGAWGWSRRNLSAGLTAAIVIGVALAVFFGIRFARTGALMPAGMLALVSIAAVVVFIAALKGRDSRVLPPSR
jgi:uncharacterized membrane protein (UPF0136 family)